MEFLFIVAFLWFIVAAVRNAAREQQRKSQVVLPPDWFNTHEALPETHVRRVAVAAPLVAVPARSRGEASTSELMWDETADDEESDLAHAEVVSLERAVPRASVDPRPLPAAPVTLETEVDWEEEHQRFHTRYVDAPPQARATARGLMDDLRDPAGARHAVLLAEILGPPVSMRR